MKCIDCPLYRYDGSNFSCPGIPYHDFNEEGMFADPNQPVEQKVCVYARVRLRTLDGYIKSLEDKWQRTSQMIQCYQLALMWAPDVPEWKFELERRLKLAFEESSRILCEKLKHEREKSTIVAQLGSLKNL